MNDRVAVYLPIAGCLLFAGLIVAELDRSVGPNTAIGEAPIRTDVTPAARQPEPRVALDELLRETLARPLFSATRRPPQKMSDAASDPGLTDTRLAGIVTELDQHLAIFAIAGAKPVALTEGETVSGWRIDNISPHEVTVSGPSGTKILQPRIDPNTVPKQLSPRPRAALAPPPRAGASPVSGAGPMPVAPKPAPPSASREPDQQR
jgi:hypothetical protein